MGLIASGALSWTYHASGAIRSGHVASGSLQTDDFASGATVMHAMSVVPIFSGSQWAVPVEEPISGGRAVAVSQSGRLWIAMASVSGRMPAIGVVDENVASGAFTHVHITCMRQFSSGMADFSGYLGKRIWVGRSGQVVAISGSWNSGGFASGDIGQTIGTILNSGGVLFNVVPVIVSGGALGFPPGGPF